MSAYRHDDRKFAVFFTIVGLFGLPVSGLGLYAFGSGLWPFGQPGTFMSSASGTNLPALIGLVLLIISGTWLLRQYWLRARSRPADVCRRTVWKLSTAHNGALLAGSLALFTFAEAIFVSATLGIMALWSGFLFLLSTIVTVRLDT